jgi:proline iminopeptidase
MIGALVALTVVALSDTRPAVDRARTSWPDTVIVARQPPADQKSDARVMQLPEGSVVVGAVSSVDRKEPVAALEDMIPHPIHLKLGDVHVRTGLISVNGTALFAYEMKCRQPHGGPGAGRDWSKTPLVIIHGGPGLDHSYFLPWINELGLYGRVLLFDQRGCGGSDRMADTTKYAMDVTVSDIEAIRQHLGAEKICVLGFSYGGFVALKYALAHPDHVAKLILSDTAPSMAFAAESESLQKARQSPEQKKGFEDLAKRTDLTKDQQLLEEFKLELPYNFHHPRTPEFMNAIAEKIRYGAEAGEYIGRHDLPHYDVRPQLASIGVPTLVMVGDDDIVTPPSQAHAMYEGINAGKKVPNATLKIIAGAGHLSMIDNQDAFNHNIIEFLSAPPTGAAH